MVNFLKNNVDMSALCSMRTGGVAKEAYFPDSEQALCEVTKMLLAKKKPFAVLGNLSNVLVPDTELPFVPVITTGVCTVEYREDHTVYASCGVSFTKLAFDLCKMGLGGMEFAYGIPGTVGGAVFMNAGAYGSEVKNILKSVRFYDLDADCVQDLPASDCDMGYRHSIFSQKNGVILGAEFSLTSQNAEELVAHAKELMQKRISKQPLEYPSCGSAFKRPEGYFAGELIERCGLKGFSVGGACVSEKHAGFVINKGGATTKDVIVLMQQVQKRVYDTYGVTLEPEIRVIH